MSMKRLLTVLGFGALLIGTLWLGALNARDWTDVDLHAGPWTFDRGVEYGYFADTSGTVHQVITTRKYLTSTNGDKVRAFLAWDWPGDTTGAGYDLSYDAVSGRYYWYGPKTMPFGSYLFVEIGGSPDTLITSLQYAPVIGKVAPLDFVDSTAIAAGHVTSSKLADRISIPGSFYVTDADSFATIRLLTVQEQLDTPDLRYFAGDSIAVQGVFLSMNAGATVRDTLTVARTGLDPGVVRFDDAGGYYLLMENSGVGGDWVIDWANPTLYYLTIGTSASQGTLKLYDGSSNYHTFKVPATATNYVTSLPSVYEDGSWLHATVSGSTVTLTTEYLAPEWRKRPLLAAEFVASSSPVDGLMVGGQISLGGSTALDATLPDANHPGVWSLSAGAGANTGYYYWTSGTTMLIGGGECAEIVWYYTRSTNTVLRLGFIDTNTTTAPTDGAWINVAGTTLDGRTASNSTSSTTGTTYTVSTATWYRVLVEVNAAGTQVDFTCFNMAGTVLWTNYLTTNIPTGAGRLTGFGLLCYDSVGGVNQLMSIDYAACYYEARALTR